MNPFSLFSRPILADTGPTFWFPPQGSTVAHDVDWLFYEILWISIFFFVVIVALMLWFVVKYRRRTGHSEQPSPHHNTALELTWSVGPLLLSLVIFYEGFVGFLDLTIQPANTYDIQVTGQKWKWLFTYPNGHVDEVLHVPGDRATHLIMSSEDVIHSLFIPDFRVKKDVVPGRFSHLWFQPTAEAEGEHELFCTEYCGTSHSNMITKAIVHPAGGFDRWLSDAALAELNAAPAEAGQRLYGSRGCAQCHSVDGKAGTGPSFKGIFDTQQPLTTGTSVLADENYIRESILEPQAKVVAGFSPVMPTYAGRLSDREIVALIEYIKTLK
jgi:cytochrome c oxidase subunit 2